MAISERLETIDEIVEKYCVSSSPLKSKIYVSLGYLFVMFAIIGIWVPGWPTVSWAVPAAFLFSLSNETLSVGPYQISILAKLCLNTMQQGRHYQVM